MMTFKAGFGRTGITPKLGVRLSGYGIPVRPAESIHDPLYSSALILEQAGVRYAIISLDWLCIATDTVAYLKDRINKEIRVPVDNIIICTIHTHSAPNTLTIPGWGDADREYIDSVLPAIIESAKMAAEKLTPARMGVGSIPSLVGVNRRTVLDDGSVSFDGNTEGAIDPNMTVLRLVDGNDSPIVTLVHYGAHCTAWGNTREVSRDWPGVMLDRLEGQTGGPAMFINGTLGDVGPRMNIRRMQGRYEAGGGDGLHSVLEVGYRAATDAIHCYDSIDRFEQDIAIRAMVSDITIPAKPLPALAEVKARIKELEPYKDQWGGQKCDYEYWNRVLEAHSQPLKDSITYESRIIILGPVAIVSLPGEPFSSISLRIRQASPFAHTLIVSNGNGSFAYIPDKISRSIGGYEVAMESALLTYLPVDTSDEYIVDKVVDILKDVKQ